MPRAWCRRRWPTIRRSSGNNPSQATTPAERSGGDELLRARIDLQVEPFEQAGAEQDHIAGLCENTFVDRFHPDHLNDRVADVTLHWLAGRGDDAHRVRHDRLAAEWTVTGALRRQSK